VIHALFWLAATQLPPLFEEAPFDFGRHFSGAAGKLHLVEMMGAGVGLFDADGDGDLDLLVLDGAPLEPGASATHGARLYRNLLAEDGKLGFREATAESGLAARGYGFGMAAGDIDGDGDLDLFLANYGADQLWRNLGGLRFEEISATAGVSDPRWSSAASFFDYDRDGKLDLYVANYVDFDPAKATPCYAASSRRDYCGPSSFPAAGNSLFRNLGEGRFENASLSSGIAGVKHPSLGVAALDFDRDGLPDIYVANDGEPNELWRGDGKGRFENLALEAGAAINADGQPEAGMGVAVADFDEDGDEDIFLTHLLREKNTLYVNLGDGTFADRSAVLGLAAPSLPFTSFGTAFLDLDRDGWLDLVTVSGGVKLIDELLAQGDKVALGQRKQLFRNQGGKRFEDWSGRGGPSFERLEVSRGLAAGDVDNDGDADLLVGNNGGQPRLLLAEGPEAPWLGLRLLTGKRDAYLARVELKRKNAPTLHRTVRADGSYGATSDPRLLFGLAGGSELEQLLVHWPDGQQETFPPPPLGTYTTLRQGSGTKR
jgi:hypothetical protein